MNVINEIGSNIRDFRKKKGLTQKELGELIGVSEISIRRYEKGESEPPIQVLDKIADKLDISIVALLGIDPLVLEDLTVRTSQKSEIINETDALKAVTTLLNDSGFEWSLTTNELRRIRQVLKPIINSIAQDIVDNSPYIATLK